MYLIYQEGNENVQALCLTKTAANDIRDYLNRTEKHRGFAFYMDYEPVDLQQFVKEQKEKSKYLDAISGI